MKLWLTILILSLIFSLFERRAPCMVLILQIFMPRYVFQKVLLRQSRCKFRIFCLYVLIDLPRILVVTLNEFAFKKLHLLWLIIIIILDLNGIGHDLKFVLWGMIVMIVAFKLWLRFRHFSCFLSLCDTVLILLTILVFIIVIFDIVIFNL